jgi:thiol-disulfide isomerase/thioredoxin
VKLTLMKVGAGWCGPCQAMAKRGTLEKFAKAHPEVKVEVHDDTEAGGSRRWEAFADKWQIKSVPTLIWLARGEELLRSNDVTMDAIEKQFKRAAALAEET